jgi:phage shock protein PspC (stress-responsive transcriptional regulator)
MQRERKLYRSRTDSVLTGVCGGLAEYFGIDSKLVRALVVGLAAVGIGFPFYIALWIFVPYPPGPPVNMIPPGTSAP